MNEKVDLAFFEQQWDTHWTEGRANRKELWDDRAGDWDAKLRLDGIKKEQGAARVRDVADYLRSRGLLGNDCSVADIGCGPGRFVAEFARTARNVLGVDISPKMTAYGESFAQEQRLENVSFRALDFQNADIGALGWEGAFDLVFSSITPAVRGLRGLNNLIAMSRAWCFNACFVRSTNDLQERILRELFDREPRRDKTSHSQWFYELFSLLWMRGYFPETRYYRQHRELPMPADLNTAKHLAEYMFEEGEYTPNDVLRIQRFLEQNAEQDGSVLEVSDCWYGWLLWDIRDRRPV